MLCSALHPRHFVQGFAGGLLANVLVVVGHAFRQVTRLGFESLIPWSKTAAIFTNPANDILGPFSFLVHAVIVLAVEWLVLYWMYQRKIFLTA